MKEKELAVKVQESVSEDEDKRNVVIDFDRILIRLLRA